jgi:hypothetical protein
MFRLNRRAGALPLALASAALAGLAALAAPVPTETAETIKDRAGFIPNRKYQPLPGKSIGVLVSSVQAMMGQEGRSGPPDACGFSRDLQSYRWVYVPVTEKPLITNLNVNVGEKGDQIKVYPSLSMANPQTVKPWDVTVPFALVEVEVNDALGAPAQEGFVATKMRRLDDTKEYPLQVPEVVAELRKRYQTHVQDQQKSIEGGMSEAQKAALKDRKPTGPRETAELFYVTWLSETERLRVHFRTRITDGAYQIVGGGEGDRPRPLPLPPPPKKDGQPEAAAAFPPPPPPPPRFEGVRTGTSFGVEFGVAYEVTKNGKVDRVLTLPIETFQKELPLPPGGPRGGLDRLPVDKK